MIIYRHFVFATGVVPRWIVTAQGDSYAGLVVLCQNPVFDLKTVMLTIPDEYGLSTARDRLCIHLGTGTDQIQLR